MGEGYSDFPGIEISTSEDDVSIGPKAHRYEHIDDFDWEVDNSTELHLYAFDSEDRRDELIEMGQKLREDFVFATMIIWPDELRENVEDADTFRMRALEWAYAVWPHLDVEVDEMPRIADQAENYIEQ